MAKGVLGIILCPMVDDNLTYCLKKDQEQKRVIVVNNEYCGPIKRKLEGIGQEYELTGWKAMLNGMFDFDRNSYNIVIYSLNLGLHSKPDFLKSKVEEVATEMQWFVDGIGFYLGTCGNYQWDPSRWCREKGFKPSVTFHDKCGNLCDDCVGINIAGGPKYNELQQKYTGHFYLFPAMAQNYDDFMEADQAEAAATEACLTDEMREVLGIEPGRDGYIRWLFSLGNYEYVLKIDTGLGDRETFDRDVENVAKRTGLKVKVADDYWADLQPTEDLYAECKALLKD